MKRIWSSSRFPRNPKFSIAALISISLIVTSAQPVNASRGGIEEPGNSFTVGFTFKFGSVDQLCSGALISPTVIATARHCVYSSAGEYATDYIFSPPGTELDAAINPNLIPVKVKRLVLDPNFKSDLNNRVNDIAFIQLDKALGTKGFIKIASKANIQAIETSTVYGYGYGAVFETGINYSVYPRRYSLDWIKSETQTILSNTFSLPSKINSACRGDSGGPIVAKTPTGESILIGLLSGAADVVDNCGTKSSDGNFYMRLTAAHPFLPLIVDIYNPNATPSPSVAPIKKKTITCIKGKLIKKVTAVNPKCPTGYRKK